MTNTKRLGPPVPANADDWPPMALDRIERVGTNGLGEQCFVLHGRYEGRRLSLIIAANPVTWQIKRAAIRWHEGHGFVGITTDTLPGNISDILTSLLRDAT